MPAAATGSERQGGCEHRGGPCDQHEQGGDGQGPKDLPGQPGGRGEQAEHDEQADLGEPADPSAKPRVAGPCGSRMLPSTSADGQKAAGARQRRGG